MSFRVTATPHQGKPMASMTPARPWLQRPPKRTRPHHEAVRVREAEGTGGDAQPSQLDIGWGRGMGPWAHGLLSLSPVFTLLQ